MKKPRWRDAAGWVWELTEPFFEVEWQRWKTAPLSLQEWGGERDLGNQTTGLNPDSELECCYHGNCEVLLELILA